ncbi:Sedoheptulose-1,7-bisphosphatase, chloroplastic [Cyphellophora attinorum]|uniref:Sedoheptulose-1,7-bisphosphatase, chloroplastic n=1 Tax=Cyphellophora attinorum TaxID=1664694 RepID=A0A0N1H9L1_9EURO|nr:Sedoheptulose-1,7-bisphosphatase, chloroplastic [Phialophora attinorum]KPI38875.1 Sedoheptulose-1,7-bisphosphatase, chloroplastic [Phialophora attinorum]
MGQESGAYRALDAHLDSILPPERQTLGNSVIPTLLSSIGCISTILRHAHSVSQVGSSNAFGDEQLNVDVLCEKAVRDALTQCPSIVTASSEEDPVERPVQGETTTDKSQSPPQRSGETYTIAFDPLDGSSIIAANWTIGTIIGIWTVTRLFTKIHAKARSRRFLAFADREPVQLSPFVCRNGRRKVILNTDIRFTPEASVKTRYFAPANLRAAASDSKYLALVNHHIKEQYTLRYSGGLVPDVVHMLVKGHGVFINPVSKASKPKLRKLYELFPVALVIECAGGKAVNADDGEPVLNQEVADVEERGGFVCGTSEEVDFVVKTLVRGESIS